MLYIAIAVTVTVTVTIAIAIVIAIAIAIAKQLYSKFYSFRIICMLLTIHISNESF